MIISQITLYHLRMRLQSPFETSFGTTHDRECIILEAQSGEFLGYGECVADADPGYSYETAATAWHILQDFLIPQIINTDLRSAVDLQSRIAKFKGHPMAKAGLELVYWDLLLHSELLMLLKNYHQHHCNKVLSFLYKDKMFCQVQDICNSCFIL